MNKYLNITGRTLAIFLIPVIGLSVSVIAYSFGVQYKKLILRQHNAGITEQDKLVDIFNKHYMIIVWFFGIMLVPILAYIYSFMMQFVFSFTFGLYANNYDSNAYKVIIPIISFVFALITYFKIGMSMKNKNNAG